MDTEFTHTVDVIEFLRGLHHDGMMHCFEDGAANCLDPSVVDTAVLQERVNDMLKYCEDHGLCPYNIYYKYVERLAI